MIYIPQKTRVPDTPYHPAMKKSALLAGIPQSNASLFRRIGVPLGDPAAWIQIGERTIALVRDLEMDRTRLAGQVDAVTCPAENAPPTGLSADRETATAQSLAQLLRHHKIDRVTVDRTLPQIYTWHLQQAEIELVYDPDLGVLDRRQKTADEIEKLAAVQSITEEVMRLTCEQIAAADVDDDGHLVRDAVPLTSEWVRQNAAIEFLRRGCGMSHGAICATLPHAADCHHAGTGPLKTGQPIIVDLFPCHQQSRYWGDCTRTVVHGQASDAVVAMHRAVQQAKQAATIALVAGQTAAAVHLAATNVLLGAGYRLHRGEITDEASIQHGTGHGVGLNLHEPILLDDGGGKIFPGEVFTIEPGLYGRTDGGVRIEDMVVATDDGPRNLNSLHEGLDWWV